MKILVNLIAVCFTLSQVSAQKVIEKEPFIWQINSDTLKLKFERESEVKNVLFKKDKFLFKRLPYNKKHIELRYLDFKECGVELEFIE